MDDGDLAAAARDGEPVALGLLLEAHRAAMRAVAVSLLGWGPDAEDAVQDAMLVALRRIGDLRDPAAAGPWLRAVTRNECRARLRRRLEIRVGDLSGVPAVSGSPERAVEQHALRDWVWSALESLPEPLQVAVLLRYFTEAHSYEQIAAACDIPVGTVRSRLHEARRRLTALLLAERPAGDSAALAARRRRDAEDLTPWDPGRCPPGVLWLMRMSGDGIERIRLFHPARGVDPDVDPGEVGRDRVHPGRQRARA